MDQRTVRHALEQQIDGVLRGTTRVGRFVSWWRASSSRVAGCLMRGGYRGGRDAFDRTHAALEDWRAGRIGDAELVWVLRLTLGELREPSGKRA